MSLDGGDRGGFLEYMEMVTDGAITAKIQNWKDLMRRQPIDHQRGHIEDKISQFLVYGDQQVRDVKIKIDKIRRPL